DARFPQPGVADSREMVPAEHVAKLVLIAEPLVPVGVEEEVWSTVTRPPRFLEVVVQIGVASDERRPDTSANGIDLIWGERAGAWRRGDDGRARRRALDATRHHRARWHFGAGRVLRDRGVCSNARTQ